LNYEDNLEYHILKTINYAEKPIGAAMLALLLAKDVDLNQSSIGRRLLAMDYEGKTQKVKRSGRVLTPKGLERLKELEKEFNMQEANIKFLDSLNIQGKDKIIQVLQARRGLEKESARLAAYNRNDEHIEMMHKILKEQRKNLREGKPVNLQDVEFHNLIAVASNNTVILNALKLIRNESIYSPVLASLRIKAGGDVYYEHLAILEQIKIKDPEKAEQAMQAHIDRIINEFDSFFAVLPNEKDKKRETN